METRNQFALIGAGPMGLAMAKVLKQQGVPFQGFELHSDVGGLWDIDAPRSTVYDSAHLISSKKMTQFADFPMRREVAEYPAHHEMKRYFREFAEAFDLYPQYRFNAEVVSAVPNGGDGAGWVVTWKDADGLHRAEFAGVMIANGTLSEPNMPEFEGQFDGELIHAAQYRHPSRFHGKRVLIVGGGNSGCDIAVDAIHHGISCDLSMRRGSYFIPKYVFGRPADQMGDRVRLPLWLKRRLDRRMIRWFIGNPQKYGFPRPDYELYESHPVVNSLVVYHAGHGDLRVRPQIARLDGDRVHFSDGSSDSFDMIVAATGYRLHYPFIDRDLLNWQGDAPHLFLNALHPDRDDLFVLGMVEASGLGWQGRHEQAEMIVRYIRGLRSGSTAARALQQEKAGPFERVTGGMNYIKLARMAYYVDKRTYRRAVNGWIDRLKEETSG